MAQGVEEVFTVKWMRPNMPHCVVHFMNVVGVAVPGPFPVAIAVFLGGLAKRELAPCFKGATKDFYQLS